MQVKQTQPIFDIPDWVEKEKHCFACRELLFERKTLDICSIGLDCQNEHHYIVTLFEPPLHDSASIQDVIPPRVVDANEITRILYWLTDWNARSRLNSQLADMLRRIVEIKQNNLHIIDEAPFNYCLMDGESLEVFEQSDVWLQGLRCGQGHRWFRRGKIVMSENNHVKLNADLSDKNLDLLVQSWLAKKNNQALQSNLHPQIVDLLNWYEETTRSGYR